MHTFAQKAAQQTTSTKSAAPGRAQQSGEASSIVGLHRTIGNQAIRRFLEPNTIQRKLTINSPGDPFEREADDMADKVMRMVAPTPLSSAPAAIQRKCAECEEEGQTSDHKSGGP